MPLLARGPAAWGPDYSVWLDVGCNLVFAYGRWRAHQTIFLLLPNDRRSRVGPWLAWTLLPDAPRPVRRLLNRLGRALRRMTGWGGRQASLPQDREELDLLGMFPKFMPLLE